MGTEKVVAVGIVDVSRTVDFALTEQVGELEVGDAVTSSDATPTIQTVKVEAPAVALTVHDDQLSGQRRTGGIDVDRRGQYRGEQGVDARAGSQLDGFVNEVPVALIEGLHAGPRLKRINVDPLGVVEARHGPGHRDHFEALRGVGDDPVVVDKTNV